MKIIHCSLWGDVEVSDLAISIIDTPHFQRLHYIKQTGMAYKVFPGATTSRFEHSIGVYYITQMLLRHLLNHQPDLADDCDERCQELICIAGLIHDIGHGPYSHLFDEFLKKSGIDNGWIHHENRGLHLFRHLIQQYDIPVSDLEIAFIEDLVLGVRKGTTWYNHIINNKISGLDTDKIDYVLRDSLNLGMKISFDPLRIIKNSRIIDNELCFCDRIKDEIMTVFLIRNKMNRLIYRHPKICELETKMLQLYDQSPLKENMIDIIQSKNILEFIRFNDYTFLFNIPADRWEPYECRKIRMKEDTPIFQDREWPKIKHISFYNKKTPSVKFFITDWTLVSCF